MKKIEFFKGKAKAIFAGTFLAGIILSGNVFATTELKLDTSAAFDKWNNLPDAQKAQTVMPRTYDIEIPDSILNEYEIEEDMPRVLNQLLGKTENPFDRVGSVYDSRFNLAEKLNLRVEHQKSTTECWAFSVLKAVETNYAIENGLKDIANFSERHMDYATSRNFTDGINEAGFNRDTGNGGLLVVGLAYLTNGQGAVLESDMPFKDDERKISLSEIDKNVDTIVNDYITLPTIHKEYQRDVNGNTISVKYKKSDDTEYTKEELDAVRNIIKKQLVENGAIASMTGGNYSSFYNNSNTFSATAYNCNITTQIRDHAITIVGWDDNYPKENFGDGKMPSTDGAYIVLNSYGDTSFDNGYIYISYEDFFIEEEIYGIESTGFVDYDNIYQHDYYGGIHKVGLDSQLTGSFAVSYQRDPSKKEILNSVGISLSNYANVEIYINPEDSSLAASKLMKVGESTEILSPGFHRLDIIPTELTGHEFSIVVKQVSESGGFYFKVEANIPNTVYGLVDSEQRSYLSLNGNTWTNIRNLNVAGIDMSTADVCIKAYTIGDVIEEPDNQEPDNQEPDNQEPDNQEPDNQEPDNQEPDNQEPDNQEPDNQEPDNKEPEEIEITSEEYTIKDGYIMNIKFNTTKEELLNNITVNSGKNVINSDGTSVEEDEVIKTGMKLRLSDGSLYTLIVRGDINMDGKVSLTDLSKLILHYNEVKNFELIEDALKAADMNIDGIVNLVDISQMLVLYNSI